MNLAVETHDLTKRYGSARGIEGLDLEVPTGEVFGFLGPNGAGKSTTIRTLLGFQRPTSGTAKVLGLDAQRQSVDIRQRVGYLPGDLHLFDRMTGAAHIEWFADARGGCDRILVADLVERFGVSLDRPVTELSKGNRQKVGLVLACMNRPDLLVLDEPTSGLDPLVQAAFETFLRETVAEGRSVLLSSHSLDEVQRIADRIAIIRDGTLVVTDTVEHLRAAAPRVITMRFAGASDPAWFAGVDGLDRVTPTGEDLELELRGEISPVLEVALAHQLVDLTARHADLDELFLSYYGEQPSQADPS